jgi:6-pyruvoyltetrahydropterin/6-carboxytetrahydropterin synthase
LPDQSLFLDVVEEGEYYRVCHHTQEMRFLQSDTLLLPLRNTTVEDLSHYLLGILVQDTDFLDAQDVREIELMVSSGPGQTGGSLWRR